MSIRVINPVSIFGEFKVRANRIRKKSGTIGVIKGVFWFLIYPFYKKTTYRLYIKRILPEEKSTKTDTDSRDIDLVFKVITSNWEADQLELEGYSFRSYPTPFNWYRKLYSDWLEYGVTACCTFVGKEFGAINWVITNQKSHNAVKAPRMKIDYANREVMIRGVWVNPKFTGTRLFSYTARNRDYYLSKNGFTSMKATIDTGNKTGSRVARALGGEEYGRGQALRILWLNFWRESYFKK